MRRAEGAPSESLQTETDSATRTAPARLFRYRSGRRPPPRQFRREGVTTTVAPSSPEGRPNHARGWIRGSRLRKPLGSVLGSAEDRSVTGQQCVPLAIVAEADNGEP